MDQRLHSATTTNATQHASPEATAPEIRVPRSLLEAITGEPSVGDPAHPVDGEAASLDRSDGSEAPRVTVALPLYNAASDVTRVLDEVVSFARSRGAWSFVFVDDGSTDGTGAMLRRRLRAIDIVEPEIASRLSVLSYAPNAGKGHAVRAAAMESDSEYFLFTDGDLAYSLDHLPRLLERLQSADVVIGSRLQHDAGYGARPLRRLMGWVFNRMAAMVLSIRYRDTQAGLKGFRSRAAHDVFSRLRIRNFAFDVEVLYVARKLGYSIAEIPAHVESSHKSSQSTVNLLRDPLRMLVGLCRIRAHKILGLYRLHERDLGEVRPLRHDGRTRSSGRPPR